MAEPENPSSTRTAGPPSLAPAAASSSGHLDKMVCERCGQAEMFRMHAVWRCPNCGFKTDCCGW